MKSQKKVIEVNAALKSNICQFPTALSLQSDISDAISEEKKSSCKKITKPKKAIQHIHSPFIKDEFKVDLKNLSAMALRSKYKRESNAHRNMKTRVKKTGGVVSPEFTQFRNFLASVGRILYEGKWTLDRINNKNPDYGPKLVRWADSTTQNNNKSDTILLTVNGITKPLTVWARNTDQKPNTLRRRRMVGWSDYEIVYAKKKSPTAASMNYEPRIWGNLLVGKLNSGIQGMENKYLITRKLFPSYSIRRERWLAAYSLMRKNKLHEEIIEMLDENGRGPHELERQYKLWNQTYLNAVAILGRHIRQCDLPRQWRR